MRVSPERVRMQGRDGLKNYVVHPKVSVSERKIFLLGRRSQAVDADSGRGPDRKSVLTVSEACSPISGALSLSQERRLSMAATRPVTAGAHELGTAALPATWFPRTTDGTVLRATKVCRPIFLQRN